MTCRLIGVSLIIPQVLSLNEDNNVWSLQYLGLIQRFAVDEILITVKLKPFEFVLRKKEKIL